MKYLMKISYDGSRFEGFQRLRNGRGVQNEVERVLSIIASKKVVVKGASRTDRGVHANNQGVSFDLDINISLDKLKYVVNNLLNPYVKANDISICDMNFHARFNALKKRYVYKIYKDGKDPFLFNYVYLINYNIDTKLLYDALKVFIGKHNFKNFVSGEHNTYESEIYDISIEEREKYIIISITGKAFYRYMVRSIIGAALMVALHKRTIDDLVSSLELKNNNRFVVAPPNGLYLDEIWYK